MSNFFKHVKKPTKNSCNFTILIYKPDTLSTALFVKLPWKLLPAILQTEIELNFNNNALHCFF